ncbi:MAG: 4Fe-4S dicluster domain-containing protein [Thermodesulfovibrionales bacterium]|nr:4Fe-4S dicluster domain-containing protein [Thermodesulfovibrionales bacterium]
MNFNRRDFLKIGIITVGGLMLPFSAFEFLTPKAKANIIHSTNLRWVFLVDIQKCVGCGMCVKGCSTENDAPTHANLARTWIERYIITKDGTIIVDSPQQAYNGFTKHDVHGKHIPIENISKAFFVPKLCNQCDLPICVDVCPVGATYKTPDGIVHIDRKWCIGCAACISNCPYSVRFIHPTLHVVDKCNFCYHRISNNLNPVCVDACAFGSRKIGNLKNPDDPVTQTIMSKPVAVLKPEFNSKPHVFYLGLSYEVK